MFKLIRQFSSIQSSVRTLFPSENRQVIRCYSERVATAIRKKKSKSTNVEGQFFVDLRHVRSVGGKGGDGCISFLHLWANENAGPDGGDGGNGGHVVFLATNEVNNLVHVPSIVKAENGERGKNKDCHGKDAEHKIVKVPVGTIVKNSAGKIVGDLAKEGTMFVAARGGAGGKGNHFFASNNEQAPQVCEHGAHGEDIAYITELRSMAHLGLIGLPNAGKSTLLRSITRARPKVAPYAFTTLRPHVGIVHYDDYEQVSIADLPGLIPDSHKNRGLGIQFLKHVERCAALLFIVDMSCQEPWKHFETLRFELSQFSDQLMERPHVIVANKIDVPEARENLKILRNMYDELMIVPISAKMGTNVNVLLNEIRRLYDTLVKNKTSK